jgi:hypothetical protein
MMGVGGILNQWKPPSRRKWALEPSSTFTPTVVLPLFKQLETSTHPLAVEIVREGLDEGLRLGLSHQGHRAATPASPRQPGQEGGTRTSTTIPVLTRSNKHTYSELIC